jgi:hypothetical protein
MEETAFQSRLFVRSSFCIDDFCATDRPATALLTDDEEISSEHNTTTILPIPIDLFAPFIKRSESPTPKEP